MIVQRDTYFRVAHGRLKLREEEPGEAHLIAYARPDAAEVRVSSYRVVPVARPGGHARRARGDERRRRRGGEAAAAAAVGVGPDPPRRGRRARLVRRARGGRRAGLGPRARAQPGRAAARGARRSATTRCARAPTRTPARCSRAPDPELLALAREAAGRAYAPYSNFPVGAAVRTADGRRYAGANVENAAYPQGQCAEASALGAMVAGGGGRVVEVVVAAPSAEECAPCGGCRQRLREFADQDTPIHLADLRTRAPHDLGRGAAAAVLRPGEPRMSAQAAAVVAERAPGFTPAPRARARLRARRARRRAHRRGHDPLRRSARLPRRHRLRPRGRAHARDPRRRAGRVPARALARVRGDRGERGHDPDPHAAAARRGDPRAHQRRRLAAPRDRARQPRRADRPHQPAGLQPAHGPQRRGRRPALPEPARAPTTPSCAPACTARPTSSGRRCTTASTSRSAAPASRPRRRSARSARSAPTSSGCRRCPRRSWRATAACASPPSPW